MWALTRFVGDATAAMVAFLTVAVSIPVIAYGRYFVEPGNQGAFKRTLARVLGWVVVLLLVASAGLILFLLESNN
ncbi:MAG: hypothetical protein OEV60_08865 [Actinomycetota bacterium]|nr:hypothetical protein [Actinomycetota bacterium]